MKASFLDYYKIVLEKVSFDNSLFLKEYKKALHTLESKEIEEMNKWLESRGYYANLIHEPVKA